MNRQYEDRMDRLEVRCLRLERSNHRMRSGVLILMGIMAIGAAFGFRAMEKPEHLKVASVTVCDDEGSTLAWVGKEEGYGRILLYNQHGEVFWSTPPFRDAKEKSERLQEIRDKIGKMSIEEAQARLTEVAKARRFGTEDEVTKQLLKKEFSILIRRIGELKREK